MVVYVCFISGKSIQTLFDILAHYNMDQTLEGA